MMRINRRCKADRNRICAGGAEACYYPEQVKILAKTEQTAAKEVRRASASRAAQDKNDLTWKVFQEQ